MSSRRFSFASVVLGYFLVGGGMFTATMLGSQLGISGHYVGYVLLGGGALVGGFIAARASRGRTILEAVLGGLAAVTTLVGLAATTPLGELIWSLAQDQTVKFVATVGASGGLGALVGAFFGERLFGEETRSSVPWLLYTALSVFGACVLATLGASIVTFGRVELGDGGGTDRLGQAILVGIAVGCLLAGLAVGASARVRPLIASLLGSAAGVAGFFGLLLRDSPPDGDATAGLALFVGGGSLVTLIGTAVGWVAFGRRELA